MILKQQMFMFTDTSFLFCLLLKNVNLGLSGYRKFLKIIDLFTSKIVLLDKKMFRFDILDNLYLKGRQILQWPLC